MKKILLIILDGAPDIGKRTPLSEAFKPNIDYLASHSTCGMWRALLPKNYSIANFSDVGNLQLLGYYKYPGRGYLEALGIDLKPDKKAVYLRANFSYVKKVKNGYKIIDRRAGRNEEGLDKLVKEINKINIKGASIKFYKGTGHRGVLVLKGKGLTYEVTESDKFSYASYVNPLNKKGGKTSRILNEFIDKSFELLNKHSVNKKRRIPANFLLLRGLGHYVSVKPFSKIFGMKGAMVSGVGILKGIGRFIGLDVSTVSGANGHVNTNLEGKLKKTLELLNRYDFVVFHINGADEAAHDRNPKKKKAFIELMDRKVFSEIIKLRNTIVIITSDHITSSKTGMHVKGFVPFLIYNPDDDIFSRRSFNEHTCNDFITDNPIKKIIIKIKR